jgi:hypothetical protein
MTDTTDVLTERERRRKRPKGGAALPNVAADAVELGREAWRRRKADARACWADWLLIGEALVAGRERAMAEARTNKPAGKRYNLAFHAWLDAFGFADIDKADRAKLLLIVKHRDEVEAWRASLTQAQRADLNHPSAVWRAWKCPNRGQRWANEQQPKEEPARVVAGSLEQTAVDFDEEQAEIIWQRGLLLRARKSIFNADLRGHWRDAVPPDDGLIAVVRKAAEAWTRLAESLEQVRSRTPEERAELRNDLEGTIVEVKFPKAFATEGAS